MASIILSILILITSVLGLVSPTPYALETNNWLLQARGQDIGNLLAVILLVTSALASKRGLKAWQYVWLGTLFYVLYAYTIYAMAVHLNSLFLSYVAIMGMSFYGIVYWFTQSSNVAKFTNSLRFPSYTLIGTGVIFLLLWFSELIPALVSGTVPQTLKDAGLIVNPVHVLDLSIVLPGFLITGYLALKNNRYGLMLILPWLTFSALMGSSIVAAMILMSSNGYANTLPPLIMVSLVTILSIAGMINCIKKSL